jgi:predicted Zn-dependent protease
LDTVESDDELAGILAHEIAHNVNQHAIERMRSTPRGLGLLQLAAVAALIIGKSPEAAVLANTAANAITAAVLKGSSIDAEKEADAHGINYLTRTKYNPTGFLTFLERLASSAGKFFEEELGIYQTHPLTRDRVRSARSELEEHDVPILRRLVIQSSQPEARLISVQGKPATEIAYEGERLFVLAGQDSARSAAVLATVSWVLDRELKESDIKIIPAEGGVLFEPGTGPSTFFSAEDGRIDGRGEAVFAGELRTHLAEIVIAEQNRYRANFQFY